MDGSSQAQTQDENRVLMEFLSGLDNDIFENRGRHGIL